MATTHAIVARKATDAVIAIDHRLASGSGGMLGREPRSIGTNHGLGADESGGGTIERWTAIGVAKLTFGWR